MSSTEQWSNLIKNPYEIDATGDEIIELLNTKLDHVPSMTSGILEEGHPLPDDNFENFNPLGDLDIDDFLTKELRDLDIPVLTKDEPPKLDFDILSSDLDWNRTNDTDQSVPSSTQDTRSITPRNLVHNHRKNPSGTAIFGFANHNKTLSIGSKTIKLEGDQYQPAPNLRASESILQQQKELQLALERQQEMNEKLEEQLRINKLQQEQLQRALEAQQLTLNNHVSSISGTPVQDKNSIIITSNGKNGKYQFPPPSQPTPVLDSRKSKPESLGSSDSCPSYGFDPAGASHHGENALESGTASGLLSPLSRASVNGSPQRRRQRNQESGITIPNINMPHKQDPYEKMSKYFEQLTKQGDSLRSFQRTSPITPQFQIHDNPKTPTLRAPLIRKNECSPSSVTKRHSARDSEVSTASTIPVFFDEDDSVYDKKVTSPKSPNADDKSAYKTCVGLGIMTNSDSRNTNGRKIPAYQLEKPQNLKVLPTIPGSSDTTPLKQPQPPNYALPLKHSFQHTPTKENIFRNTSLRPDRLSLNCTSTMHCMHRPQPRTDEPECEFVQAQTPSPILRSQERFDSFMPGSSPHYHFDSPVHYSSTTKRNSMLSREEIDKYIIELGPKHFQCKFPNCGKYFNRRYNARTHIQTHLCDRPYKCDFEGCDKAFVRNHDLLRHKKSHIERCHQCVCGKRFNSEEALTKHKEKKGCTASSSSSTSLASNQIRKPISPKKVVKTVQENFQCDHNVNALRMQHQLANPEHV